MEAKQGIRGIVTTSLREPEAGLHGKGDKLDLGECRELLTYLWTLIQSIPLLERRIREKEGVLLSIYYLRLLFGTMRTRVLQTIEFILSMIELKESHTQ